MPDIDDCLHRIFLYLANIDIGFVTTDSQDRYLQVCVRNQF